MAKHGQALDVSFYCDIVFAAAHGRHMIFRSSVRCPLDVCGKLFEMIASRLRWRLRRCRGWPGALSRIEVQVAGTERRHAARANTPWHLRFVWRFDEESAVRRVFAVVVDAWASVRREFLLRHRLRRCAWQADDFSMFRSLPP